MEPLYPWPVSDRVRADLFQLIGTDGRRTFATTDLPSISTVPNDAIEFATSPTPAVLLEPMIHTHAWSDLLGLSEAVLDMINNHSTDDLPVQASNQPPPTLSLHAEPAVQTAPQRGLPIKRTSTKKRARIFRDGQLTMIEYGANEALTWVRRVAVFQDAMRHVLGDRRLVFKWSGSVTDSVVGAFLTQNVSDSLSSRAYMEVASRWPAPRGSHRSTANIIDWEAVRVAPIQDLADAIKCRGMYNSLSINIKNFLNHIRMYNLQRVYRTECLTEVECTVDALVTALERKEVREQTSQVAEECTSLESIYRETEAAQSAELLSLEWLRDVPPVNAREFLMGINGLGRKSVACIMLLTLGFKEFPVDTNVGRICSRLGWIPLEANHAIEELDDYAPEPEVHAFLHSRLLQFSTETLYELHYQMITLGKVFCSKANPNCKACPMQKECEYALNNGPSLHGRKRTTKATVGSGEPQYDGNGAMNARKLRTRQKHERHARELEEHDRLYSTLSLEQLIERHSKGLRTYGLRRSKGVEGVEASLPSDSLPRLKVELSRQAKLHQHNDSIYKPIRWFPIVPLRKDHAVSPSIWDIEDLNELARMDSPLGLPGRGKVSVIERNVDLRPEIASIWDLEGYSMPPNESMQPSNEYTLHEEFVEPFTPIVKKSKPVVEGVLVNDGQSDGPSGLKPPSRVVDPVMEAVEPMSSWGMDGMPIISSALPTPEGNESLDAEIECDRILRLGEEIAEVARLRSRASQTNPDHADVSVADDQLTKLSSAVLGMEELDWSPSDSLAMARSKFKLLARLLHPDKCSNPKAADVFAVVRDAMSHLSAISPHTVSNMSTAVPLIYLDEQGDGFAAPDDQARRTEHDMTTQSTSIAVPLDPPITFSSVTWNQSRLVVSGYVVPEHLRNRLPKYYRFEERVGNENSADIIFLPLAGLPTLSRSPPDNPAFQNVLIESVVENMLQTLPADEGQLEVTHSAQLGQIPGVCEEVEGLLLVTCRYAMRGQFPLNGTYFQINEVFLDHSTASSLIKLPRRDLLTSKTCLIYFGLGIHYLAKAMNQAEVAHMFSDGWVCFRAFDLEKTRAPMPLPQFLMPSIPSNNKSAWKTKAERLAAQRDKATAMAIRTPGEVRFAQQQISAVQESTQNPFVGPSILTQSIPASPYPYPLHSIVSARPDARDDKGGKARTRSYIMPAIPAAERCGTCRACSNPAWKKACETRRAEILLAGGPYTSPPAPGAAAAQINA